MRLIDADELKEQFPCLGRNQASWKFHNEIQKLIDDAPTVDLWHYPSRGELPDKDVECLVITKSGNKLIAMIDSSDNCWCTGEFFSEYLKDECIKCWQYIVPPEEEQIKNPS